MDFVYKKEKIADLMESYIEDKSLRDDLMLNIDDLLQDEDFKSKDLFNSIFNEIKTSLEELSNKELKQRILMIRSFIE